MASIPEEFQDLFEKPTIAHVVTMSPDETPHAVPVWVDYDADENHVIVNTERHRRKAKNAERDSRVAVSMTDPENPYRYLSVTGVVEELRTEGAEEHTDELAKRYTGEDEYGQPIQSERVQLRIRPEQVRTSEE